MKTIKKNKKQDNAEQYEKTNTLLHNYTTLMRDCSNMKGTALVETFVYYGIYSVLRNERPVDNFTHDEVQVYKDDLLKGTSESDINEKSIRHVLYTILQKDVIKLVKDLRDDAYTTSVKPVIRKMKKFFRDDGPQLKNLTK